MNIFLYLMLASLMPQEELRFNYVYKQGFDSSCGIAVTATLLNKYWNISVSLEDLYQEIIVLNNEKNIVSYTVSFSDISGFLNNNGLQTRAFRMNWEQLHAYITQNFTPIIIHYGKPHPHFALLLHIQDEYAFVADPARGYEVLNRNIFESRYSGNVLLVASRYQIKDEEILQQVIKGKQIELNRMQQLARRRW